MSEDHLTPQRQRLLQRYFQELEDGNLAALAAILHEAEHDEALERSLLALNDLYQDESVSSAGRDEAWSAMEDALHEQGLWPVQDRQDSIPTLRSSTRASIPNAMGEKQTGPRLNTLRDTRIFETPDEPSPTNAPPGASFPHGQHDPVWPSMLTVAVVVLLLIGFIAVMTTRGQIDQSGIGGSSGAVASTVTGSATSTNTSAQDDKGIVLGCSNGVVTAWRANDGSVLWNRKFLMPTHISGGETCVSDMLVRNGVVYMTRESGIVLAVRARDGSAIWSTNLTANPNPAPATSFTPRLYVSDGFVLVRVSGGDGTTLLRASDGAKLWVRKDAMPVGIVHGVALIDSQGPDQHMYAVDCASGKTVWVYDPTGMVWAVAGNATTVFGFVGGTYGAGANGDLVNVTQPYVAAFRLSDGALLWRQVSPMDDTDDPSIAVGDQLIYVQTRNSEICAYRQIDGAKISCGGVPLYGEPMYLVNGTVYLSNNIQVGSALALQFGVFNSANGNIQWLWRLPAVTNGYQEVHVQGDVVIAIDPNGVGAYRLSDGHPIWQAPTGEIFAAFATGSLH